VVVAVAQYILQSFAQTLVFVWSVVMRSGKALVGTGRRSTLMDVARLARVHSSTVSRTLSHPELVAPHTRARVEAAVAELNFTPNRQARSLHEGRTGAIGLLVPDIANPYFAEVIRAAQDEAALNDLVLLVADTQQQAAREDRAFRALQPHVDGIIVCTPVAPDHPSAATPVVYVNRRAPGTCSVTVDQHEVVRLAAAHLLALGHRRILWLNGPANYWSAAQRREAIFGLGTATARHDIVEDLDPTFDGGWKAGQGLLGSRTTAVVAFNDLMALGVLAAAASAGVSVPGDLSLVGSDDVRAAAMSWPPLTSVASPFDRVGKVAVQALMRARDGRHPRSTVLAPTLTIRQSTARRRQQ
jgi:DNA-binding LacI/PurR family transcriptional regulator